MWRVNPFAATGSETPGTVNRHVLCEVERIYKDQIKAEILFVCKHTHTLLLFVPLFENCLFIPVYYVFLNCYCLFSWRLEALNTLRRKTKKQNSFWHRCPSRKSPSDITVLQRHLTCVSRSKLLWKAIRLIGKDHLTSMFYGVPKPKRPSYETNRLIFDWQKISGTNKLSATVSVHRRICDGRPFNRMCMCVWQREQAAHYYLTAFPGCVELCASATLLGFLFYFRSPHVWASVASWNEGGHFSPSSQMTSAQPRPASLSSHFASRPVLLFPAQRVTCLRNKPLSRPITFSYAHFTVNQFHAGIVAYYLAALSHLLALVSTLLSFRCLHSLCTVSPTVYTCLRANWPLRVCKHTHVDVWNVYVFLVM